MPTIDDVLEGGRFDVISLGFVLALWSGSRALNVFVDTITIMHGLGGHRGIVEDPGAVVRALRAGDGHRGGLDPARGRRARRWSSDWLPERLRLRDATSTGRSVVVLCICFLATLYHVSVPVRTNWSFNLPGATFSLRRVDRRLLPAALGADRDRGRLPVDLRPAGGADRGAALALPGRDRGAHRGGGQRAVRHGLPAEGDDPRPPRARQRLRPGWSDASRRRECGSRTRGDVD